MNKMGPPPGNKNRLKLKEPELRQEAYRQYCEYIAGGNTKDAWVFDHPQITLTSKSMEKYIKDYPLELLPIHKERAEAKSYEYWLELGLKMMLGKIEKCQPAIYQMFMRNKFGWDKETRMNNSVQADVIKLLEKWEKS